MVWFYISLRTLLSRRFNLFQSFLFWQHVVLKSSWSNVILAQGLLLSFVLCGLMYWQFTISSKMPNWCHRFYNLQNADMESVIWPKKKHDLLEIFLIQSHYSEIKYLSCCFYLFIYYLTNLMINETTLRIEPHTHPDLATPLLNNNTSHPPPLPLLKASHSTIWYPTFNQKHQTLP